MEFGIWKNRGGYEITETTQWEIWSCPCCGEWISASVKKVPCECPYKYCPNCGSYNYGYENWVKEQEEKNREKFICDDCIYNFSSDTMFRCSHRTDRKNPLKSCQIHTTKENEMPGDMFWNQPIEDFYDYTDEKLKLAFPNKWETVRKRINEILEKAKGGD